MPKINITNLDYYEREEEKQIIDYLSTPNIYRNIFMLGDSGTGKTELAKKAISIIHESDCFSHFTIIHLDAIQIPENCEKDTFYSFLTYQLLKKTKYNESNVTYVTEENTFLSFLDKSTYIEEVKSNAKKVLISALSLIPNVGSTIYSILNSTDTDLSSNYQTAKTVFFDYLSFLNKETGLIIFVDNIQTISDEIVTDFNNMIRQLSTELIVLYVYCLQENEILSHSIIKKICVDSDALVLKINNVSILDFEKICEANLCYNDFSKVKNNLSYYYGLVQTGNMKEIDEFIFQVNLNGIDDVNDTPTIHGIQILDDIKKDIIDLLALFPEGIKISFVERVLEYNQKCTSNIFKQSIATLSKMNYILINENDMLRITHSKYAKASRFNIEVSIEEERFTELINSCEHVFTQMAYEECEDSEFVFCVDTLVELKKHTELIKHLGILDKYINLLYSKYRYSQICMLYKYLTDSTFSNTELALLFPLRSIIQLLDSMQKTSNFETGLRISNGLSNAYNLKLFEAKFLLQSYHYTKAIDTIKSDLNNYESWSIYLNALQHLRKDEILRREIDNLTKDTPIYDDLDYYYIILRNCGHLYTFEKAFCLLNDSLNYFKQMSNKFIESTCLNNIGILYLYKDINPDNLQIAKDYFVKAKQIMHDLKSNEEYQSMVNLGVVHFCEENYSLALEYFELAKQLLPTSLTFDLLKLESNIFITKYALNIQTLNETRLAFLDLVEKAEKMPDPWISLLCNYNLYILKRNSEQYSGEFTTNYPGDISSYGLYLNNSNTKVNQIMLVVSPHWRY